VRNPSLFYTLGLIFIILGFIDLAFLTYSGHDINGAVVTIWGVGCLVWGVRNELIRRQ